MPEVLFFTGQKRETQKMNMPTIHLEKAGDFYEAYRDDAKDMANALGITLTTRRGMPMAGVPAHAVAEYIDALNKAGFNVKFNRTI